MNKMTKNLLAVILVIAAVGTGIFVYNFWFKKTDISQQQKYDSVIQTVFDGQLYESDIENVYYTLSPAKFYQQTAQGFVDCPFNTAEVSMTLFNEPIAFTLNYVNIDGTYFGFAEYATENDYYYIKGMNVPVSSSYNKTTDMLLLFDASLGLADYDRLYSEAFIYNVPKNQVKGIYVQERNRTLMENGKKRPDYAMFTTEMLQRATARRNLFLTRAFYEYSDAPDRVTDVNSIKYGYTSDSKLTDILFNIAYDTPEGKTFHYARTESGFQARLGAGNDKDQVLWDFKGEPYTEYVRSGDYIVNVSNFVLENSVNSVVNPSSKQEMTFTMEIPVNRIHSLRVSPDGTQMVIFGTRNYVDRREVKSIQIACFVNLKTGKTTQYLGEALYDEKINVINFVDGQATYFVGGRLCAMSF